MKIYVYIFPESNNGAMWFNGKVVGIVFVFNNNLCVVINLGESKLLGLYPIVEGLLLLLKNVGRSFFLSKLFLEQDSNE